MRAVKGQLDNKVFLDLAHRTEPVHRVAAHPFVEVAQFPVGEA